MKTKITYLLLLLSILFNAQDGTLDTTFGTNGKIDFSIFSSFVDMKIDYNNKIVALGKSTTGIPILVRFNLDGSLDTSFDSDGIKEINFGNNNETPTSFCIYDYNSASFGYIVSSSLDGIIAKINDDGTFATFGTNGLYTYNSNPGNYNYSNVTYDYTTGKILVCYYNSSSYLTSVYKILPTGINDASFNAGNPISFYLLSGYDVAPNAINTDDNGNIYVSGAQLYFGGYDTYVRKFSSNGSIDYSYTNTSGGSSGRSYSYPGYVFDASNNTSYTFGTNGNYKMMITKKTANGLADTTFGTSSVALVDFTDTYYDNVKSITGHEFGSSIKIILAGRTRAQASSSIANISLARIDANGVLDTTFGTAGYTSVATNQSSYTQNLGTAIDYNNGKLYVMGLSSTLPVLISLYRFNLDSILSSNAFELSNKPTFFPNPTTSNITFSKEINSLEIVDITGKKVKSFENVNVVFDVSNLETGIYILKGKTIEGDIFNEKLVKE